MAKVKFVVSRERFIELGAQLPSIGLEQDGKQFGGAFFFNHELHLTVLPQFHGRWGQLVRPMWEWMLSIEDPVTLRVEKDNLKCLHFMDRQCWPRVGEDDEYISFRVCRELLKPVRRRITAAKNAAASDV